MDPSAAGHDGPGSPNGASPVRARPDRARRAERLWCANRRWVAAILLAHKPRDADLDDLLQSVAATVVRKIHEVRDPRAERAWLRRVAINQARLAGRQKSVRMNGLRLVAGEAAAADGAAGEGRSDGRVELDERVTRVLRAIDELPEQYREPLALRCVRGMSYRQIAAITGMKETTIETRIARGRRVLRETLAAGCDESTDATTNGRTDGGNGPPPPGHACGGAAGRAGGGS